MRTIDYCPRHADTLGHPMTHRVFLKCPNAACRISLGRNGFCANCYGDETRKIKTCWRCGTERPFEQFIVVKEIQ